LGLQKFIWLIKFGKRPHAKGHAYVFRCRLSP
jgi:hypothetical protein